MKKWRVLQAPVSIKWSLFRNMTFLVLLIAGGILLFTFISSKKSLEGLAKKQINQTTDYIETELKRFLLPVYSLFGLWPEWEQAGIVDGTDRESLNAVLIPIMKRFPQISSVITGDPEGNSLLILRKEDEWLNREVRPAEWQNKVRWVRLDDALNIAEEWWEDIFFDPRDRPWYKEAVKLKERLNRQQRKEEQVAWTRPYLFEAANELGLSASNCITKKDGSFYVLAMDVLLDDISVFTLTLEATQNSKTFVVTDTGSVIGLPYDKKFLKYDARRKAIGAHIAELGIPVIQDALAASQKANTRNFLPFQSGKKKWWGNTRSFFLDRDQQLIIGVVIPEDDYFEDANRRRKVVLVLGFAALILAFVMANLLTRRYSQPINQLVEQSERIGKLDMTRTGPITSKIKEVNSLADAQDKMRAALKSFASYIPTEVVKELLRRGQAAKIGGKTDTLTVMFSDIHNFTTLAESTPPEKLTAHLAEYFEAMLVILREEKATVDKFVGDSIVAFWGAPVPDPGHARHAARAALRLKEKVAQLNKKWEREGKPQLPTSFGLSTGDVLVGNVGASERLNYTVLGDTVNLASRLEGINRQYGTQILVSKSVKEAAGAGFKWKFIDSVKVKGKTLPVDIFELTGKEETS